MNKTQANKVIRQRVKPKIYDYCFFVNRSHLKFFKKFKMIVTSNDKKEIKVLDVGCGYKPFKEILGDNNLINHIGIDFDTSRSSADIVATAEEIPFPDNYFDGVIASEILEHVSDLNKAIQEIRRVSKGGCYLFISSPFLFGEHGVPYDFQRITLFQYKKLFINDEIIYIHPTNTSLSAPFLVFNQMLEYITIFKKIPLICEIFYIVINLFVFVLEMCVNFFERMGTILFRKQPDKFKKIFENYFFRMPVGYEVVVKINK